MIAPPDKGSRIRSRIADEDALLNTRTTIFLATNGLWIAVVGVARASHVRLTIAALGLLVTVAWAFCSWQSWRVIRALTRSYLKEESADEVERIVQGALWRPGWWRPSDLIAKALPILFLLAWLAIVIFQVVLKDGGLG